MSDTCPLCGYSIKADAISLGMDYHHGCNAEPLAEGQCCETCDKKKVIRVRLAEAFNNPKLDELMTKLSTMTFYDGRGKVARRRKQSDFEHYREWHRANVMRDVSP